MKTLISAILLVCICGCSTWKYERTSYNLNGKKIGKVHASAGQLFLTSSLTNVQVKVDPNSRSLSIGEFKRDPDEESIKAIAEALPSIFKEIFKPDLFIQ